MTPSDPTPPAATAGGRADPSTPRRLALVVDDEPSIRALIARLLLGEGWSVIEAGDGEAALGIASGRRLDLLVSDVEMPHRSGPSLAASLRRLQRDLPVVLVSGADPLEPLPDGRSAFVRKPFAVGDLLERVARTVA